MIKQLVICPLCSKLGIKNVLGEVTTDGGFAVLRFHNGLTKIRGQQFEVECGNCGEVVFFRQERRANGEGAQLRVRQSWLLGGTFSQDAGTGEAGSITS